MLQKSLQRWHKIVATRDTDELKQIISEDVVFRSPVVFKPYSGRDACFLLLSNVLQVWRKACLVV